MKSAIISLIKDEHRYIKEWVQYHLNLGFDSIILYEDYGSKSHKGILRKYPEVKIYQLKDIDILNWHSCRNQFEMFHRTLEYYKKIKEYDWILYSDPDEFLVFDNYSLEELFEEFKDYGGLWIPWKMYGANRHIKRPKGNVMDNYTTSVEIILDGAPTWNKKSFVNMHKANFWDNNHIINNGCNINKSNISDQKIIFNKIWLNHYFTKSFEDYYERMISRGNLGNSNRSFDQFFLLNPDMISIKKKIIDYVRYDKTNNVQYISHDYKIISGGNINEIQKIKNKLLDKDNK